MHGPMNVKIMYVYVGWVSAWIPTYIWANLQIGLWIAYLALVGGTCIYCCQIIQHDSVDLPLLSLNEVHTNRQHTDTSQLIWPCFFFYSIITFLCVLTWVLICTVSLPRYVLTMLYPCFSLPWLCGWLSSTTFNLRNILCFSVFSFVFNSTAL